MTSLGWNTVALRIKEGIKDQKSILSQFPLDAASITTREVVLSLHADCACKKAPLGNPVAQNVPVQAKKNPSRHGNAPVPDLRSSSVTSVDLNKPTDGTNRCAMSFTVKVDTDADVEWVMQAINYGLTMPQESWEIVSHSVHLYTDWLGCLLPAQLQKPHLPHALLANPVSYARRILFSLARFFAPRNGSGVPQGFPVASADAELASVFSMMHQMPRDPMDGACTESVDEILRGISSALTQTSSQQILDDGRWLQEHYLPLATAIVRCVEQILFRSHLLTTHLWDALLEFGLAVCFSVLTLPPQVTMGPGSVLRPFSQHPVARGLLQLDCLVFGMLVRIWIRALSQHYPSPGHWRGLEELTRVSRHRVALGYIWSRIVIVFTYNLLRPHIDERFSVPGNERKQQDGGMAVVVVPQYSAYCPLAKQLPLPDIPDDMAGLAWFRFLHLLGNPVDLCHPDEITHTPVFEHYRRCNATPRCRFSAAFLPTVFHQLMRSLSIMVDLFLGLAPSLSGCVSTFAGVPVNLYGLVDVTEYFQYASIRAPDAIFAGDIGRPKHTGGGGGVGEAVPPSLPHIPEAPNGDPLKPTTTTTKTLAAMLRSTGGISSTQFNAPSLSEAWLDNGALVSTFYNKPEAIHLLDLLGPWLFEAAISGTTAKTAQSREGVMISERSIKVDGFSYHVGRAEAMTSLCRIFIYAERTNLPLPLLVRFYVCLIRALTVDEKVEYILSTVLLHSPDLLRTNLDGTTVLLPSLFSACQWVLGKQSVTRPDFVSMTLLRRASLHQLLSMVCLPNQFEGIQFQEISPFMSNGAGQPTTRSLRRRLATLLCDLLSAETDSYNVCMLLSGAYALTLDMMAVELVKVSPGKSHAEPSPTLDTASGMYVMFLERLYTLLPRWMNDSVVANFALEVLSSLADVKVSQPSLGQCRQCIRGICAFIEKQCRREEKRDHTRTLHSLIVRAFRCLETWLVAHPATTSFPDGQKTLRTVVETIKLGIFGATATVGSSGAGGNSGLGATYPPPPGLQRNIPSMATASSATAPMPMPYSKRVNEAAEQLLSTLFLTVGTFPEATGPATLSCRLCESDILKSSSSSSANGRRGPVFHHFLTTTAPELIVSVSEGSLAKGTAKEPTDAPPVLTFFTDLSGRHLWSWKPRFLPIRENVKTSTTSADESAGSLSSNGVVTCRQQDHLQSCLDSISPQRLTVDDAGGGPFFPRINPRVPLVKSETEMPTLVDSALNAKARKDIDALKSLIGTESLRTAEVGRRTRDLRLANALQSPLRSTQSTCRPLQTATNIPSTHVLLSHLGYVPVNSVHHSSESSNPVAASASSHIASAAATAATPSGPTGRPRSQVPKRAATVALLSSTLMPLGQEQVARLVAGGPVISRATGTLFVFYVSKGQTNLTQCIANMVTVIDASEAVCAAVIHRIEGCRVEAAETGCIIIIIIIIRNHLEFHVWPLCVDDAAAATVFSAISFPGDLEWRPNQVSHSSIADNSPILMVLFMIAQFLTPLPPPIPMFALKNGWSKLPKNFQSFVHSLGLAVACDEHPGWRGSVRSASDAASSSPRTADLTTFQFQLSPNRERRQLQPLQRRLPDGVDGVIYWASHTTEIASLCPSRRTEIVNRGVASKRAQDDTRAAVLWLEYWDDALWNATTTTTPSPPEGGAPSTNPLQAALRQQLDCGLVILVSPLSTNGLFRVGLVRCRGTPEAGPLVTGLVVSGEILGALVRNTLVNTICHLTSNSGDTLGTNVLSRRLLEAGAETGAPTSAVDLLRCATERCY